MEKAKKTAFGRYKQTVPLSNDAGYMAEQPCQGIYQVDDRLEAWLWEQAAGEWDDV